VVIAIHLSHEIITGWDGEVSPIPIRISSSITLLNSGLITRSVRNASAWEYELREFYIDVLFWLSTCFGKQHRINRIHLALLVLLDDTYCEQALRVAHLEGPSRLVVPQHGLPDRDHDRVVPVGGVERDAPSWVVLNIDLNQGCNRLQDVLENP
jgi:hypothetical protein